MNKKPLILLVGKSGSGKTTIAKFLEEHYGMKMLESYTTRPQRYMGERGHEFVDINFYLKPSNKVAHTQFDGHHYWATQEQCDASDIYIIDPDGVKSFIRNQDHQRSFMLLYLDVSPIVRFYRMYRRGDSVKKAFQRILHDRKKFGNFVDEMQPQVIYRNSVEHIAKMIYEARG